MNPPRTTPDHTTPAARRAVLLVLALLTAGLLINSALIHPTRNYLLDFRAYYAAGHATVARVNPYDPAAINHHLTLPGTQRICQYLYPPPTLAIAAIFAQLPYPAAQIPWTLLQTTLLLGTFVLTLRTLNCRLDSPTALVVGVAFMTSTAVSQLFHWGQFDAIPLFFVALAFWALSRHHTASAGVALGLATVAKISPLLYLGVFIIRRQRRALITAAATITLPIAITYVLLGPTVFGRWLYALQNFTTQLPVRISPDNMSLSGLITRALVHAETTQGTSLPWLNAGPDAATAISLIISVTILTLTTLWMIHHRHVLSNADCLAATIPVALLISGVTWTHHGVQLLIPLALITATALRTPRLRTFDATWLLLTLILYTNWPVDRFQLQLPPQLAHAVGPTLTYALLSTWLFMLTRFVPLKRATFVTTLEHATVSRTTPPKPSHDNTRHQQPEEPVLTNLC